jgi:ADP-heptose:LPS heptosyltransferase
MRRILILRGGALGDFIVTLPALAALRSAFPAARIELAGNAPAAALAVTRGLLDDAHSQHESRWAALYASAPLPPDFAAWLASFDLILNFWPDPDGDLARRFPLQTSQRFLTAPALPTVAPAAAHFCAPLRALGITTTDYFYPLDASEVGRVIPSPPPSSLALHPGSGSPQKNWPLPRWLELAAWLRSTHSADLFIITGEAEPPAARAALASFGPVAHALPLEDLIAHLASCRLLIGHDTGISHLAAACGVPCLLLFGPTDPALWAPPAPHVQVLRHAPTLDTLSLSAVQTALTSSHFAD